MKHLLLPFLLLLSACGVSESEYETLEQKCRQLESQNRVLQRDLRDARNLNEGLNEEVDHFSRRMNDEATTNRDRLAGARVTLIELRSAFSDYRYSSRGDEAAARCDSLLMELDNQLSSSTLRASDIRPAM